MSTAGFFFKEMLLGQANIDSDNKCMIMMAWENMLTRDCAISPNSTREKTNLKKEQMMIGDT